MDFNILTFHKSQNYGAVLQAFALQEFIKKCGYTVGIFDYRSIKEDAHNGFKSKILEVIKFFNRKNVAVRSSKYKSFVSEYLNTNKNESPKVFLVGSDQVWNPTGIIDPVFFLQGIGNDSIKASYAASLGVNTIPKYNKALLKDYLNIFDHISLRESTAADIIKPLYDKLVSIHVDPALLHNKDFWRNYMQPVEGLPQDYILLYLLHRPKNINKIITSLKKSTGLKVVLIEGQGLVQGIMTLFVKHNKVLKTIGPKEFLYLFNNARIVVTSSFHGTVFSLIFHKEFYSFSDNSSRISDLLNKMGLPFLSEFDTDFKRNNNIDWEYIDNYLANERNRSKEYISSLLKSE